MTITILYNYITDTWTYRDNEGEHPLDRERIAETFGITEDTQTLMSYDNDDGRWAFTVTW